MDRNELMQLGNGDKVRLYGKQYKFDCHNNGCYVCSLVSKNGNTFINVDPEKVAFMEKGW